jgi:hypothetical protein
MTHTSPSQRIAAHIDEHHPRLGSRLMKLRWAGLRTIEPDRTVWTGVSAFGLGIGLGARTLAGRDRSGRHRVPLVPAALLGGLGAWIGTWRWDSARWRRSHVTLVLDLPTEVLDSLVERLGEAGVRIERWDGSRRVDGPSTGVSCRLRDLRRVNAEIDALDVESSRRVEGADPTGPADAAGSDEPADPTGSSAEVSTAR